MKLGCFVGRHDLGGIVARGSMLHCKCPDCGRLSPGWTLDRPRPTVTQPVDFTPKAKSRLWWLRAVYEKRA